MTSTLTRLCCVAVAFFVTWEGDAFAQTFEASSTPQRVTIRKRPQYPPEIHITAFFKDPSGKGILQAEEEGKLNVTLTNTGRGRATKLKMVLAPSTVEGLMYQSIFELGNLEPGEPKTIPIPVRALESVENQSVAFKLMFSEGNEFQVNSYDVASIEVRKFAPPDLTIDPEIEVADANKNGMIEPGEIFTVSAKIRNRGLGEATQVRVHVRPTGDKVFLAPGTTSDFAKGTLGPGDESDIRFTVISSGGASNLEILVDLFESRGKYGKPGIRLPLKFNEPFKVSKVKKGPSPLVQFRQSVVDVDVNIPTTSMKNPDAVAVVIGIANYKENVPPVEFAALDAVAMKEYLVKMIGYSPERIIEAYNEDATFTAFNKIFEEQLPNWIVAGKSDVFVFYSGHGAPDLTTKEKEKEPYFVPYDCDPNYARSTGFRVKKLYDCLSRLNCRSITVVIDACFSGNTESGIIIGDISPPMIPVENPLAAVRDANVFTSTKAEEVASWNREKQHGLFTYFLLRALRGEADLDRDGSITIQEIDDYVTPRVSQKAREKNRIQTPQVMARDRSRVVVKY